MEHISSIPKQFYDLLQDEIVSELLAAGDDALSAYEQGRAPDGSYYFSNYTLGCCFWDNFFNRIKRTCLGGNSFFHCAVYNNVLEVSGTVEGRSISFFISRVDRESRQPRSGKGIKKLLHAQIVANQQFLSEEVKTLMTRHGVFTLGVDLDAENGIGKVTFDLLVPSGKKSCQALTYAELYNSDSLTGTLIMPEKTQKGTVTRSLAKSSTHSKETPLAQPSKKAPHKINKETPAPQKIKK